MIDNYNDLPLGKYLAIDRALRSEGEEIDKQVAIIAILADKSVEDILTMPLDEYVQYAAKTAFLREEVPPVTAPDRVIVGGRSLIPTSDFTKIVMAQYVDFQTFCNKGTDELPMLLAAFLIPEGAKAYGEGYDVAQLRADLLTLPTPVALSLVGFFFERLLASIEDSLTSLSGRLPMMPKERRAKTEQTIARVREMLAGAGLQI